MSFIIFILGSKTKSFIALSILFSLIFYNVQQFLSFYQIRTFLRSAGDLFCRLSLSLGLFDISSWLDFWVAFLTGALHQWWSVLSASYLEALDVHLRYYYWSLAKFDMGRGLRRWVVTGLLFCKGSIFPL